MSKHPAKEFVQSRRCHEPYYLHVVIGIHEPVPGSGGYPNSCVLPHVNVLIAEDYLARPTGDIEDLFSMVVPVHWDVRSHRHFNRAHGKVACTSRGTRLDTEDSPFESTSISPSSRAITTLAAPRSSAKHTKLTISNKTTFSALRIITDPSAIFEQVHFPADGSGELRRLAMGSLSGTHDLGVHELAEVSPVGMLTFVPNICPVPSLKPTSKYRRHVFQ